MQLIRFIYIHLAYLILTAMFITYVYSGNSKRTCLITLQSNFEIFQKGHPAVGVMLDRRIFER